MSLLQVTGHKIREIYVFNMRNTNIFLFCCISFISIAGSLKLFFEWFAFMYNLRNLRLFVFPFPLSEFSVVCRVVSPYTHTSTVPRMLLFLCNNIHAGYFSIPSPFTITLSLYHYHTLLRLPSSLACLPQYLTFLSP